MFTNKKGKIMRHPYATMIVLGLATVGAISITSKVKQFFKDKGMCVGNMINGMHRDHED